MSIKAKISLNITEFKKKIQELRSFIKSSQNTKEAKSSFQGMSAFSLSKNAIGMAFGAITDAFRRHAEIALMWFKTKQDNLRNDFEQYDKIITRSQKKSSRDKSDLSTLEGIQMKKGPLTNEEKELQHQAALRIQKNNPGVKIEYDTDHKIKNFGDLQYNVLNKNKNDEQDLLNSQIKAAEKAYKEQSDMLAEKVGGRVDGFFDEVGLYLKNTGQDLTDNQGITNNREEIKTLEEELKKASEKLSEMKLRRSELNHDTTARDAVNLYRAKQKDAAANVDSSKPQTFDYAVIGQQIKTNSLTARGGFVGGAAVTDEVSFRQGVKDKMSTIATAITTIVKDTDTLAKKGDEKL